MKKFLSVLLTGVLVLSFAACASKAGKNSSDDTTKKPTTAASSGNQTGVITKNENDVDMIFHPATSGSYATIKIDSRVQFDDETAWLGLVPAGKDYITELEADDVDVIWFNYDTREDGDPYVFACDFESVEDGRYALVVTSSDDENVGYVVIQLAMEKKGDKLTFDYTNAKWKERPEK